MAALRTTVALSRTAPVLVALMVLLAGCGSGSGSGSGGGGGNDPGADVTLDPANAEQDGAAEALLKKALRAANAHYFDGDNSYDGFDAAAAAEIDASITWLDATEPAAEEVSIAEALGNNVHLVTRSESGVYFCLRNLNQFGRGEYLTGYGAAYEDVDEAGDCIGEGGN